MNTEHIYRCLFAAMGAVATALAPTLPYIVLCTAVVLADCLSAWRLARRVRKSHPNIADGKIKSNRLGKVIWTLTQIYALLIFAHFLHMYVTSTLPFNALKLSAGAVIFWQVWSILENMSSCNGAHWAKLLQQIMIDKTERHFDVDLKQMKGDEKDQ